MVQTEQKDLKGNAIRRKKGKSIRREVMNMLIESERLPAGATGSDTRFNEDHSTGGIMHDDHGDESFP